MNGIEQPIRSLSIPTQRRAGFTLVELLVSIGIMLVMLALAGQVLSLTVRATGQATALTSINQAIRAFEQTVRDDLRHVRAGESILVIQSNPINAYWTQDGLDADDNGDPSPISTDDVGDPSFRDALRTDPVSPKALSIPRADILMFFTARQATTSLAYAKPGSVPQTLTSNVQQVVYGHARLGEYQPGVTPGTFDLLLNADEFPIYPAVSPTPAERWHLARRVVHIMPVSPPVSDPPWADYIANGLQSPRLLMGAADVVGMGPPFSYEGEVLNPSPQPVGDWPLFFPPIFDDPRNPLARSQLDTTPPAPIAERLGQYFLPHCASFKVEWTMDPVGDYVSRRLDLEREVLWIDLGDMGANRIDPTDDDPLVSIVRAFDGTKIRIDSFNLDRGARLDSLMNDRIGSDVYVNRAGNVAKANYSMADRFKDDPVWQDHHLGPRTAVFTANRGGVDGSPRPDELFPTALRLTVDIFDENRRLGSPIRHVIVVPIGE